MCKVSDPPSSACASMVPAQADSTAVWTAACDAWISAASATLAVFVPQKTNFRRSVLRSPAEVPPMRPSPPEVPPACPSQARQSHANKVAGSPAVLGLARCLGARFLRPCRPFPAAGKGFSDPHFAPIAIAVKNGPACSTIRKTSGDSLWISIHSSLVSGGSSTIRAGGAPLCLLPSRKAGNSG